MSTPRADVIVVGGGGAGLAVAIEAAQTGARVVLFGLRVRAHCRARRGGIVNRASAGTAP